MDERPPWDRTSTVLVVVAIGAALAVAASVWAIWSDPPSASESGDDAHAAHASHDGLVADETAAADEHAGHADAGDVEPFDPATFTAPTFDAPYDGPVDAPGILAPCADLTTEIACVTEKLTALLTARGSVVAFGVLADLAELDPDVDRDSHPIAHDLGAHALDVYGTIQDTLANCSYEVFQGCFHGAIQEHFRRNPSLEDEGVRSICPEGTPFEEYTCLHGLGHGLMLATEYDVNRSLETCDMLDGSFGEHSCYGGVFMENVVAYLNIQNGGHQHGHGTPDIDPQDPYHPCNAVDDKYEEPCWLMQTSLIVFLNHGDFADIAAKCATLDEDLRDTCFVSMGRDASAWGARDPGRVSQYCSNAAGDDRGYCFRGFVAEVILNYADPYAGARTCAALADVDKKPCYFEVGVQGYNMIGEDGMAELCATVETSYVNDCRIGAMLPRQ